MIGAGPIREGGSVVRRRRIVAGTNGSRCSRGGLGATSALQPVVAPVEQPEGGGDDFWEQEGMAERRLALPGAPPPR